MKLYKEGVNSDVLKYSFGNWVTNQWNYLPEENNANSINMCKNRLDLYTKELNWESNENFSLRHLLW